MGLPDDANMSPFQLWLFEFRYKARQFVEAPFFSTLFLALTIINTVLLAMTFDGE